MLMWLASYPRSGNTLLRIVLKRAFDIDTWSLYDDADLGARAEVAEAVGHRIHRLEGSRFVAEARASATLTIVKTHERPGDDAPAIYVLRDGRSALVSYQHYLDRIAGQPSSLEAVVAGAVWPGSWSAHAAAWALSDRQNTLVVRYEALAQSDPATLSAIARHIGREPPSSVDIDFAALHALHPDFFRGGSDLRNISELAARCPTFYALLHGKVAARLGYDPGADPDDFRALAQEWRSFHASSARPDAGAETSA